MGGGHEAAKALRNGHGQPPVARIADFKKFKYEENKKQQQLAKKAKTGQIKEIWLTPFMAEGDYQNRVSRVLEFIKDRHRVRLTVRFQGRQLAHKEFGYQLLSKLVTQLGSQIKVDQEPKFIGKQLSMTITPN